MIGLKLAQLPDRVPVKLTISVQPNLKKSLDDYAALYAQSYGSKEHIADLIPFMLDAFLKADTAFRKGRKELQFSPVLPLGRRNTSPVAKRHDGVQKEET